MRLNELSYKNELCLIWKIFSKAFRWNQARFCSSIRLGAALNWINMVCDVSFSTHVISFLHYLIQFCLLFRSICFSLLKIPKIYRNFINILPMFNSFEMFFSSVKNSVVDSSFEIGRIWLVKGQSLIGPSCRKAELSLRLRSFWSRWLARLVS